MKHALEIPLFLARPLIHVDCLSLDLPMVSIELAFVLRARSKAALLLEERAERFELSCGLGTTED